MIRIHECHRQGLMSGNTFKESNGMPVVDAVVALISTLQGRTLVTEARHKRLVLQANRMGPASVYTYTGSAEDMKPLLLTAFCYAFYRFNNPSEEKLRSLIENRDQFQENFMDLNDAGTDWQVLALGLSMGLTDTSEMIALYDKVMAKPDTALLDAD